METNPKNSDSQIINYVSDDSGIAKSQVQKTISLFEEGATIPFIARYRKEVTGGLDETQLRTIQTQHRYYQQLNDRKKTILSTIQGQGKLTDSLEHSINTCRDKQALEDLYLPYKVKRKTKADIAIENGYLPLAELIIAQCDTRSKSVILQGYSNEALNGAQHIISQRMSETAQYRQWLRQVMSKTGVLRTKLTAKAKEKKTKFDMYADFSEPLHRAASHRILAIRRGETEKLVTWKITIDDERALTYLRDKMIRNKSFSMIESLNDAIEDAYKRLFMHSLQTECFNSKCSEAETDSITVFSKNLRNLLMSGPAGAKSIMGIDPGFRTGCKVAIIDQTGYYKESATIYPTPPQQKRESAETIVVDLLKRYEVRFIAIGNGTGSKETMQFIKQVLKTHELDIVPVVVNEAGASVYSASEVAIEEYPDLDVTIRGAISIAHRLQDPLSELVKIDPKSIGVGQYQHDVNQTHLKEALTFTTESAVNAVGADLNTASAALLSYVAGIGPTLSKNIIKYRNENGPFSDRKTLLKVTKLGPKAFQQCAGFLRIKSGKISLDNSAIHPESYTLVKKMASTLATSLSELIGHDQKIDQLTLSDYVTDAIGLPTLRDIVFELKKPGLDPRAEFSYAAFDTSMDDISDLTIGMTLAGTVTNVTNFGAFVDIGVHQDGLVHISKLSNTFVKNPHDIVSVGDSVKVSILEVDLELKRIQLARVIGPHNV
ncbi:MAG: RNA-binding transcriptional accessory protein [Candidatus Margulisbacteria bacterium]|nr:RNA-binding transcriptional accessory protein [Candidatus Margulisiibacteriota bacterium]